jgi:hypothetical protein
MGIGRSSISNSPDRNGMGDTRVRHARVKGPEDHNAMQYYYDCRLLQFLVRRQEADMLANSRDGSCAGGRLTDEQHAALWQHIQNRVVSATNGRSRLHALSAGGGLATFVNPYYYRGTEC